MNQARPEGRGGGVVRPVLAGLLSSVVWLLAGSVGVASSETPPRQVSIGLYLLDLADVDDANQTMTVDFVLWSRWTDPGLAAPAGERREIPVQQIWNPNLVVLRDRALQKKLPELAYVDDTGTVLYSQRYFGEVSSPTRLADFPFDEQVFRIQVIAGGQTTGDVEFVIDPTRTGRSSMASAVNWELGELSARPATFDYEADGREFPSTVFEIRGNRHASYYVWRAIFPLVIIVFMSWAVFWIDPSSIDAQIGLAATSILTLIAFQFLLSRLIPELSYLTRMDRFTIGATVLMFLALAEVVLTSRLAGDGRLPLAKKIDRGSRIVFPLGFAVLVLFAFFL
jgi:hypothetical protein